MTVRLNNCAYEHAKQVIEEGKFTDDERDAWSDHHPSTRTENEFVEKSRFFEYAKWFLAVTARTAKELGGTTKSHMAISTMSIVVASSPHKAGLARIDTPMSKMQRQIYLL